MVSKANLLANACDGGDDGDGDFSPFNVDIGDRGYPPLSPHVLYSMGHRRHRRHQIPFGLKQYPESIVQLVYH